MTGIINCYAHDKFKQGTNALSTKNVPTTLSCSMRKVKVKFALL